MNSSQLSEKSKKVVLLLLSAVAFFLAVFKIYPLADDWSYLSAPHKNFTLQNLCPSGPFWRPLDALFGAFMGIFPEWFPYFNRAVVILCHVVTAFFLDEILRLMSFRRECRLFAFFFFLFSSGNWAILISPDALNQSFSLMFGALSVYFYLKKQNLFYIAFCFLSLLSKESGVAWFFAAPLFWICANFCSIKDFIKSKAFKRTLFHFAAGLFAIALYFALRFFLQGNVSLGESDGRYRISIFSLTFLKNIAIIVAGAFGGIDTPSIFLRDKIALGIITTFASVAFAAFLVYLVFFKCPKICKQKNENGFFFKCFLFLLIFLGTAFAHCIIGQAADMHAYPSIFVFSCFYGFVLDKADLPLKNILRWAIILLVTFAITSVHKLVCVYDSGNRTRILTEAMKENYDNLDDSLLIIEAKNPRRTYSVFSHTEGYGSDYGNSLRQYFDWQKINRAVLKSETNAAARSAAEENFLLYDKIWIVLSDGSLEVVK